MYEKKKFDTKVKYNSKYKPLELSDDIVYDEARHYYTAAEIAERYGITQGTLLKHYGEAFKAGKADGMQKPRMLLNKIFNDFSMLPEGAFARSDIPVNTLIKAIEVHARKYEGYGKDNNITIQQIEKPSVSDIKFSPLTKDDVQDD